MLDTVLSIIAPHHCCGCDEVGVVLCDDCKNYIIKRQFLACAVCGRTGHTCSRHHVSYQELYCVGWRSGRLAAVIDQLKFRRAWVAHRVLAELLDRVIPAFETPTIIVAIPTAPSHIRRRGYDHMVLIGAELARRRNVSIAYPLRRRNSLTQHFAPTASVRRQQAKGFFELAEPIDSRAHYLLIDDIFTTGSTLKEAAQVLIDAGATSVSCAVLARARQS